jgi:hypothetical protein
MSEALTHGVGETGNSYFQTTGSEINARNQLGEQIRTSGRVTAELAARRAKTVGVDPFPLRIPNQDVVLMQCAHTARPVESSSAAIRVLGFFPSFEEAAQHIKQNPSLGDVPCHAHAVHTFKYLGNAPINDVEEEMAALEAMRADHVAQFKRRRERFEAYCVARKDGTVDEQKEMETLEEAKRRGAAPLPAPLCAPTHADATVAQKISPVSEIRGQTFCAIGVIYPAVEGPALVVCFAAFSTARECERYITDTLADKYEDFDLFCVVMYEFLALSQANSDALSKGWRHQHLHDIMKFKENQKKTVEAYKAQCDANGQEVRITDVTGNAESVLPPAVELVDDDDEEELLSASNSPGDDLAVVVGTTDLDD